MKNLITQTCCTVFLVLIYTSCTHKNNTPEPENKPDITEDTTAAEVVYKKIEGVRTFDGMNTSFTFYDPRSGIPTRRDTTWLYDIDVTFTLSSDTTLLVVCTDKSFVMNKVFDLDKKNIKPDVYRFSKSFGFHGGGGRFTYNIKTNYVEYSAGHESSNSTGSAGGGWGSYLFEKP